MKRSSQKELFDLGPAHYSLEEYRDCLVKLYQVGKLTGINRDILKMVEKLEPKAVLDVGSGSGLLLALIAKKFPEIKCKGIELSEEAIAFARQFATPQLHFEHTVELLDADLIIAVLVCHHMCDSELVAFLQSAYARAKKAVVIHDLQRSVISKFLFRIISPWLFRNRLITHDGLISIERSFTRADWEALLARANIPKEAIKIRWRWPFRFETCLIKGVSSKIPPTT